MFDIGSIIVERSKCTGVYRSTNSVNACSGLLLFKYVLLLACYFFLSPDAAISAVGFDVLVLRLDKAAKQGGWEEHLRTLT